VAQEELNTFLAVAEDLKVKGLTQNTQNVKQQEFQSPRPEKKSSTPGFNTDYRPAKQQRVRPTIPSNTSERQYTEPQDIPLPQIKTEVSPPADIDAEDTDTNQMVVTTEYQDDNTGYEEYEQEYETEQVEYETVATSQHNINSSAGWTNVPKPFPCLYCSKTFANQNSLQKHTKSHTGQTYCDICDKNFSNVPNLRAHHSTVHRS